MKDPSILEMIFFYISVIYMSYAFTKVFHQAIGFL